MPSPLVSSGSIVSTTCAESPRFRCILRQSGRDAAWVRVIGELDISTASQLKETVCEAQLRAQRVVLDLRELTFIDCAAVRVIVDASNQAALAGRQLVLVRGPAHVDSLFTLTPISDAVKIVDLGPLQPPVQALVKLARHPAG